MIDPRIKQIKIGLVSCGIAAGGEAVYKELTAAAGDIPVVKVGCLGHCYAEPLVEAVLNDGSSIFYNNVPGTADAVANIECKLVTEYRPGNCPLVIGEAVAWHENTNENIKRLVNAGSGYDLQ